eukprot:scpid89969/ scgid34847/ 
MPGENSPTKIHKKKKKKEKRALTEDNVVEPIEFTQTQAKQPAEPKYEVNEEFSLVAGKEVLEKEGADDDREIWMIQVPQNFDMRQLNDQMVLLQGEQILPASISSSSSSSGGVAASTDVPRYHSVASRFDDGQKSLCNALQPSETVNGEFRGTHGPCAGTMKILRAVGTEDLGPDAEDEPARPKRRALPTGLQVRYQAYGGGQPLVVPRSHVRKAMKALKQDPNLVLSGDEDLAPKLTKRKKRKH